MQLKQLIVDTIRDNDVYEREESVRKILIKQINTLKDCKFTPSNACTRLTLWCCRTETRDVESVDGGLRNPGGSAQVRTNNPGAGRQTAQRNRGAQEARGLPRPVTCFTNQL